MKDTCFIILFFCIPVFVFGQPDIDTISFDSVNIKRIKKDFVFYNVKDTLNPLINAYIIEYHPYCKNKPKSIKEIKDGKLVQTKHFTYYSKSCAINEIFFTNNTLKRDGSYNKLAHNGLKEISGNYINGRKVGLFTFYDYYSKQTYFVDYNCYGNRILEYSVNDTLDPDAKLKNIISIDLPCLIIKEFKLTYERYLNKKNILKFEFDLKPTNVKHATEVLTFSWNNPYIGIAPARYFISIDNQHLFGYPYHSFYFAKHPFYVSYGFYYLYKTYENLLYDHYMGEGDENYYSLQSEFSNSYGTRFLIGTKRILGNSKSKFNEVFDAFVGFGYCYKLDKFIVYGKRQYESSNRNPNIPLYNNPVVTTKEGFVYSFFAGLRFGIGWK